MTDDLRLVTGQQGSPSPACQQLSRARTVCAGGSTKGGYQVKARYQVRGNALLRRPRLCSSRRRLNPLASAQTQTDFIKRKRVCLYMLTRHWHWRTRKQYTTQVTHTTKAERSVFLFFFGSAVPYSVPTPDCLSVSYDREDASSMVTAGATANTTEGKSRASRESGLLCSHSHGESIRY